MLSEFVHLQSHTEYSLSDGLLRIEAMLARIKQLKMSAIGVTDHSNLFAMVKFYSQALAFGVKPLIGCSLLLENPLSPDHPWQVLLYCQDQQGYKNLTNIITKAYLEGQQTGRPIIAEQWLRDYQQGMLLITSATVDTEVFGSFIETWQPLFLDRMYLGITRIGKPGEEEQIASMVSIGIHKDLPLVALNNVCFLDEQDFEAHEARVCIHSSTTLDDQARPKNYTRQQYLRTSEEMIKLFVDIPSAVANTVEIARRCNLMLELGHVHLPNFTVPNAQTPEQYLIGKAKAGLLQRFADPQPVYLQRLDIELEVINKMGFASYFLIVADFIAWSFANGIPVGPGRGSGAGSLVAYALNITNIDPLQYDLLFERFLNPERVSMPDFDIDFCMEGRDRVIEYVAIKYGRDSVSQIITYGTMAARAVIRDVGRVLGHPYGFVDKIAKLIPTELGITLAKALEDEAELKRMYDDEDDVKTLLDLAQKLEGVTRNVGKHAGGVVIAPSQLTNFTPLYCEPGDLQTITQFDKDDVENIGLVKFDFLGLRTLTIINWTLQTIRERKLKPEDETLDITNIPLTDPKVFDLLCKVKTTAVFQLESRGMKDLMRRLQPDCFEEIIALVALFRPGPLQSGMVDDFIDRKLGRAAISYPHPDLEPILRPTYGVILYQEQVMQIAQVLAGYTLGAADLLRRAMGKKKPEEMAQQREIFTQGAVARGVDEQNATYIFDLMEKFAGYGFNKSHSAAYALVSYQTAWLKTHYPAEFMAAVLSADMTHTDKVVMFVDDCVQQKIKLVSPCINHSLFKFSVDSKNRIVYGLGAIKGVGEGAIDCIVNARNERGRFKDLFDLCCSIDPRKVTKRVFEALINSGALDSFGLHRAALLGNLPRALQAAEQFHQDADLGQIDLFGDSETEIVMQDFPEQTDPVRLAGEKAALGLYLTGHPLQEFEAELAHMITHKIVDLHPGRRGEKQTIAGIILAIRVMITKRGDKMAFMTLEDRSGRQEVAVFADLFDDQRDLLKKDNLVIITGETKPDDYTGGVRMRALQIMNLATARSIYAKMVRLEVDATAGLEDNFVEKLKSVLAVYQPGNCSIELLYTNAQSRARLDFGQEWLVQPADQLLEALHLLGAGKIRAQVLYTVDG